MPHQYNTRNPRLCALRVADPPAFVKEVIAAIEKHDGGLTDTAESLSVTRRTLHNWIEEFPQIKKATDGARPPWGYDAKAKRPVRKRKKKAA
jgi:hypothetical protein